MKMGVFNNPLFFKAWNKIYGPDKDLPPTLSYKTHSINDYLISQNKKFDDLRNAIINKYSKKDENDKPVIENGMYVFADGTAENVNKEFAELMEIELDPQPPRKLKLQDLSDANVKLAGPDVSLLLDLLDIGEEEPRPKLSVVSKND